MKQKIIEIFNKLIGSLDTHSVGFSGRKLTALFIMLFVGKSHMEWWEYAHKSNDFSLFPYILTIDFLMIGLCLGLVTMEQIIKFKTENKNEKPTDTAAAN
jgi:hypothetical protein